MKMEGVLMAAGTRGGSPAETRALNHGQDSDRGGWGRKGGKNVPGRGTGGNKDKRMKDREESPLTGMNNSGNKAKIGLGLEGTPMPGWGIWTDRGATGVI